MLVVNVLRKGTVVSGNYAGWSIRVLDEVERTGGYIVEYINRDTDGRIITEYDDWVLRSPSGDAVEELLRQKGLTIRWERE